MNWTLILQIAGSLGGFIATVWALFMGYKAVTSKNEERLAKAKDDLLKVLESDRDAWKSRFETEHAEYIKHREITHAHASEIQALVLNLTNENATLKAKTDITPILQSQEKMGEVMLTIVKMLDTISKRLEVEHAK